MQLILAVEITAVGASCEDDDNDGSESKKTPNHF